MFYLMKLSSEAAWLHLHLGILITNTIYTRIPETAPSTIMSFLSMSTLPTPSTQADNSPSNAPVDPTTELIALMTQKLQKNTAMNSQLQRQPYPPQVAPTQLNQYYKIQHPPFTKWDETPTTKSLFLTQVATYKSEAYYTGVQDWTQTMTSTKQLSIAIRANMLSSLPHAISSIFLNNARFSSNGISMI